MGMRMKPLATLGIIASVAAGCGGGPEEVSFRQDVWPILESNCLGCHTAPDGKGYKESGLSMGSYSSLMEGTRFGPVVVPGNPLESTLIRLVEGRGDPSIRMPHGKQPLSEGEIKTLRTWVEQGAKNN